MIDWFFSTYCLIMQVKHAVRQEDGLWEVTAEVGREKKVHTALHRGLVIADQMNVRSGKIPPAASREAQSKNGVSIRELQTFPAAWYYCSIRVL